MKQKHFIIIAIVVCVFSFCRKKTILEYYEESDKVFSTTYSIKYQYTSSLKEEIDDKLHEFDDSLNPFKSSSIISKVNNNQDVILDSLFINVINRSQEVSILSEGLFDITISPLINAWGFGFEHSDNIDQYMIDSLKQLVGYDKIRIENNKLIKTDPRVNINTSAIAKGYSVDVIAYLLESYSIQNYMIEIGGEIRTKGVNAKSRCWRIAVSEPLKKNDFDSGRHHSQLVIELCDKSLATSGSYYNYYIKDGVKYAHTIDPRIGSPANNKILSATVIADDCMSADAFATVFMLADTAKIREIARIENLSYMLILSDEEDEFEVIKSKCFENFTVN